MEYAFLGFLVPTENVNESNRVICKLTNACIDSDCDLGGAYTIAGTPNISDITEFGNELESFLNKYIEMES